MSAPRVGIVMGSDSDLLVLRAAAEALAELGVEFEMTVVSAHRTPDRMVDYARSAEERGLLAIVAGAGGAAHLPGMLAAITPLPVVGVPVNATSLHGMDALLSVAQMPAGVPVATVAVDGGRNAGILAAQIVGAADPEVRRAVRDLKRRMAESVEGKAARVEAEADGIRRTGSFAPAR